ncbi:hypothetical protein [Acidiferrobacter sp.]|uniref:hypothetical protein n=1 Tax=Acidiferrobacter sp. TaxID=1872107 RepID=UPI0026164EBC|nr:hypothetical protein [Acidiferrobacter sp.]
MVAPFLLIGLLEQSKGEKPDVFHEFAKDCLPLADIGPRVDHGRDLQGDIRGQNHEVR